MNKQIERLLRLETRWHIRALAAIRKNNIAEYISATETADRYFRKANKLRAKTGECL